MTDIKFMTYRQGDPMPCDEDQQVRVRLRDGTEHTGPAKHFLWDLDTLDFDRYVEEWAPLPNGTAPVYLQVRADGKIWAVLEDGTPLKAQLGVVTHSNSRTGGVEAVITLWSAGWFQPMIGGSGNGG